MEPPRSADICEAKARLSELLRDVRLGHEWIITERGKPIARLIAIRPPYGSLNKRIKRLEELGIIERGKASRSRLRLPPPLTLAHELAWRMLDEDRGR